jgi:hypothetical protein
MTNDPYAEMAAHLPNAVTLGGALITMVEPHRGHERAYNRWYEDDHFYSGAMVGPWMFAGRRWVATRDLQSLRYPADSPVAQPVTAGCYISLYWTIEGHHDDAERWGVIAMRDNLYPQGRGFDERTHVYTAFSYFAGGVVRDTKSPLRAEHSLDIGYPGLVVQVLDPGEGGDREALARWVLDEFAPGQLAGSPAAQCLVFYPKPLPQPRVAGTPEVANIERLVTVLWFLQADPRSCWARFERHGDLVAGVGKGSVAFCAPFVPTVVGTDTYVDELR